MALRASCDRRGRWQRRASVWLLALPLLAACSPPEEILPGERYGLRESETAAQDFARAAEAGQISLVQPPPPPDRIPLAGYTIRGAPQAFRAEAPRSNAEWTHRNGGPARSIAQPALGPALTRVWSAGIGQPATRRVRTTAAPVVGGGRIYTLGAFSEVQATSTSGGAVWRRDLTPPAESPGEASGGGLAYADRRVFVTTGYGDLFALDAISGATLWRQSLGAVPSAGPTVSGGFVYLTTRDSRAWALDADTGRILWQIEAGEPGTVVKGGAAPAVGNREVLFPFGSGDLIAALRRGGVRLWSTTLAGQRLGVAYAQVGDITADPVISGSRVYVGTPSGRLAAFDLGTGDRLWTAETGALSPVWPAGGSLFLVSDRSELQRLDAASGTEIWAATLPLFTEERVRRRKGVFTHYGPVLAGGRLIVASSDGALREVDPASGRLLRASDLGAPATADPAVAGGTLYVVTENGVLHAFR